MEEAACDKDLFLNTRAAELSMTTCPTDLLDANIATHPAVYQDVLLMNGQETSVQHIEDTFTMSSEAIGPILLSHKLSVL